MSVSRSQVITTGTNGATKVAQPKRARRWLLRLAIPAVLVASSLAVTSSDQLAVGETGKTTKFVPSEPFRLIDTRIGVGFERIDANTIRVQVAGVGDVPEAAEAASMSIAVGGIASTGSVVAYPAEGDRDRGVPINHRAGQMISTGAVIPLSRSGAIDIHSRSAVDLIVDVTGSFVAATSATDGRFVATEPARILDTRATEPMLAGATTTIFLPTSVSEHATAAIVTLTTAAPNDAGHFTAFAGKQRPVAAALNVARANTTRSVTTIVPVTDRKIKVYSSGGGHLVVDMVGWFTSSLAERSAEGLFVPSNAERRLDTRDNAPLRAGEARSFAVGEGGAVLASVTMLDASKSGIGALYANGTPKPGVASVSIGEGPISSGLAVSRTTKAGVTLYSNVDSNFVVDQFGYFTGVPTAISVAVDRGGPALAPLASR